jgi:hypothetical protein
MMIGVRFGILLQCMRNLGSHSQFKEVVLMKQKETKSTLEASE